MMPKGFLMKGGAVKRPFVQEDFEEMPRTSSGGDGGSAFTVVHPKIAKTGELGKYLDYFFYLITIVMYK